MEAGLVATAAIANVAAAVSPGEPSNDAPPTSPPPGWEGEPSPSTPPSGEFLIDDIADANNQIIVQDGRNGYWYTFVDRVGSTISPPAGHKFIQSPGGANGLQYAAHMRGKVSASGTPQYATMGFNFMNPRAAYDASNYSGVSFYAKLGPRSQTRVRLKVPDVNTDPQGKFCNECSNDFGVDLELTDQWQSFTIAFEQMSQLEGWGSPRKDRIDKAHLYGVQWQVNQPGASYDIWVSDVRFTGCPYPGCQGQPKSVSF